MALRVEVPLPVSGRPARAELCGVQWVFERSGDGVRCVVLEGAPCYEGVLGLPEAGWRLVLEACAPRVPIELVMRTEVVLAASGAVRGWLALPLNLRLVGRTARDEHELLRIEAPGLRLGWREGEGYFHPHCGVLDRAPRRDPARPLRRLWCHVFLRNVGAQVVRPRRCRLSFADGELRVLRGFVIGPRIEWTFGPGGGVRVRPLPCVNDASVLRPSFQRLGGTAS